MIWHSFCQASFLVVGSRLLQNCFSSKVLKKLYRSDYFIFFFGGGGACGGERSYVTTSFYSKNARKAFCSVS